jgi:two-component system sensor histidine kinase UhpB
VDATWLARCLQAGSMPADASVGDTPIAAPRPAEPASAAFCLPDTATAASRLPDLATAASRLPEAALLAAGMADRCGDILQDIRHLLARLQPFGPADTAAGASAADAPGAEPLNRLAGLLDGLVEAWRGRGPVIQARWSSRPGPDAPQAVPWQSLPDTHTLPRPLALALYRITQEALTNVARHAQAQRIDLSITLTGAQQAGQPPAVHWCVEDDGCGLGDPAAAARRGNGLAGLRERVWALGGELQIGPAEASATTPGAGPGTRLQVWINRPGAAPPPPAAAPPPPHR